MPTRAVPSPVAPQPGPNPGEPTTVVPVGLDPALLESLLTEHESTRLPRLQRLWDYYRNPELPTSSTTGQPHHTLAQHRGLPQRLTGAATMSVGPDTPAAGAVPHREIVIENDIAWRIHTLVDFMFGKPVALQSLATDPLRARRIEQFLRQVIDHAGGPVFFQTLGLLGAVYGHVDVLLRVDPVLFDRAALRLADAGPEGDDDHAGRFVLEIIEPTRAVPLLCPHDYRRLDALVIHGWQALHQVASPTAWDRFLRSLHLGRADAVPPGQRGLIQRTEVWTDESTTLLERSPDAKPGQRVEVERRINPLGVLPVVHIQNLAQPFAYEGLSEVEPLIPLQDELNTRLSDRANRVTFQAFKMYLGKGIDGFLDRPVGPGQMWATDNPEAQIEAFGGDSDNPSEEAHVREIREALDKASAVTSVAAGLLRDKVGNVTSENALRIAMVGLLARTQQKRVTYAAGIARLCELILHAADATGVLRSAPRERGVRLDWPSPLPEDMTDRLRDAQIKLALGVPKAQVLTELGYPPTSA